jgi:hypothetical protein
MQLQDTFAHVFVPADEIKMLDKANCFDADLIEKGDWVARADVEECGDDAAHIHTNFHNAVHAGDLAKALDCGLQCLAVGIDKVKLLLVFCNLFGLTRCFNPCGVALPDKTQNGD